MRFLLFLLFISIALILYSCDSNAPNSTSQQSLSQDIKNDISADSSTFRVITTYRPATHIVLALGKSDNLVGVQDNGGGVPLFVKINPRIATLPYVGSKMDGLNIETIVGLKPNLVVLYPGAARAAIPEKLKNFGIDSYFLRIESITEMQQSLIELGKKMNASDNAQQTITEMQRILKIIQDHLQKNPPSAKKRIYISGTFSLLTTHSQEMLQHEMILKAGCEDASTVEHGSWAAINIEQLMLWNPNIIVMSGASKQSIEDILNEPKYQNLTAIKNKQLYRMPNQKLADWDYPGPDSVLGILWLAMIAYPESFADINLENEIEQFHKALYNISVKEIIK